VVLVEHADDKKVKALHGALKAIREDRAAFKQDPKGKVSDLEDDAAAVFKGMSDSEYDCLLQVDEKMEKAGFAIGSGDFSVRMV
jgi:hypothetical protein